MRILALALCFVMLGAPRVDAACGPHGTPAYDDIDYVQFSEYSLVAPDPRRPPLTFEALRYFYTRTSAPPRTYASLKMLYAKPGRGTFDAADPRAAISAVTAVLQKHDFFSMRLTPSANLYLDGPEDTVTVQRCGVSTSLSTLAKGDELDLDDVQGRAFFALEADLRKAIFAQKWQPAQAKP